MVTSTGLNTQWFLGFISQGLLFQPRFKENSLKVIQVRAEELNTSTKLLSTNILRCSCHLIKIQNFIFFYFQKMDRRWPEDDRRPWLNILQWMATIIITNQNIDVVTSKTQMAVCRIVLLTTRKTSIRMTTYDLMKRSKWHITTKS